MPKSIDHLLETFLAQNASDLYITVGSPPMLRVESNLVPYDHDPLSEEDVRKMMRFILSEEAIAEFDMTLEYNVAIDWKGLARMRVNMLRQRQKSAMVIRRIRTDIPSLESLGLPPIYGSLIMEKRGLILIVGATGSGKSTTLAAMLEHRNLYGSGHILTVEDPVEFIHEHRNCIITQRDVGLDTFSFNIALKNALRQMPDVIVIGEIRDRETMEQAVIFAETGHLCLATIHANNSNQAIERVLNFFPDDRHRHILLNLSFNLKAILSQRLVRNLTGGRTLAFETLINDGLIKTLITEGSIKEIRDMIERGRNQGMQTFDQSLLDLFAKQIISEEVAIAEADSQANLRLSIKQLKSQTHVLPLEMQKLLDVNKQQF